MVLGHRRIEERPLHLPPTIPALLRERGSGANKDKISLRLIDKTAQTITSATYQEILLRSSWIAQKLSSLGVGPKDSVILLMESRLEFYYSLFGAMCIGAIPVAVYPPQSQQSLVPALDHLQKVARQLKPKAFITTQTLYGVSDQVRKAVGAQVLIAEEVGESLVTSFAGERYTPDEPVLLQYTSGSLGDPKAIELCTRSIFANLSAIGDAFGMRPGDVGLSWLPLYHDMGLHSIFFNLMFEMPLVVMSPLDFLRRPAAWLNAASRYQVTHSPSPSFGYAYAARKIKDEDIEGIDLSKWRVAMCGAEPIDAQALERFSERFASYGFRKEALMGAYGLAENTVAVSFAPPQTGLVIDRMQETPEQSRIVASVGPPIVAHEVRIITSSGQEANEKEEGEIEVRGPGQMLRYRGDEEATRESLRDGWLKTGDLGYLKEGQLYITGRKKDLIIRAGKNYYPQDIEQAAIVDGIRPGAVAAFGRKDDSKGTEEIVVVAEVKNAAEVSSSSLREQVQRAIFDTLGLSVSEVVLVAPGIVPKTTSGKIRRAECKARLASGKLIAPPKPSILLLASLGIFQKLPVRLQRLWEGIFPRVRALLQSYGGTSRTSHAQHQAPERKAPEGDGS